MKTCKLQEFPKETFSQSVLAKLALRGAAGKVGPVVGVAGNPLYRRKYLKQPSAGGEEPTLPEHLALLNSGHTTPDTGPTCPTTGLPAGRHPAHYSVSEEWLARNSGQELAHQKACLCIKVQNGGQSRAGRRRQSRANW